MVSGSVLIMCRTPLQAFIAEKLIEAESVSVFDFVYFTYEDGPRDRYYFKRLSKGARKSIYVCSRYFSKEALNHSFLFYRRLKWCLSKSYDSLILSSIDLFIFRMLVHRNKKAELYTMDDGTANVFSNSSFYNIRRSRMSAAYERFFGAPSISSLKDSIDCHYSIYNNFSNIVEQKRVAYINPWDGIDVKEQKGEVKIFIGQPFEEMVSKEVLTNNQVLKVGRFLKSCNFDFYLSHPRERDFLNIGATVLSDQDKISEEFIFDISGSRRPKVYSLFSSVILNLSPSVADKFYISVSSDSSESERSSLCERMGCKVVKLEGDFEAIFD